MNQAYTYMASVQWSLKDIRLGFYTGSLEAHCKLQKILYDQPSLYCNTSDEGNIDSRIQYENDAFDRLHILYNKMYFDERRASTIYVWRHNVRSRISLKTN